MAKSAVPTYSLIELPPISNASASSNSHHLQLPSMNDEPTSKPSEPHSPEHGSANRVRFLTPHSANHAAPIRSKSPRSLLSRESMEASSFDNANDLQQDGPNSVSRGLQTDISSASVIDWVIAQKSSSTGDRYMKIEFISDTMDKCTCMSQVSSYNFDGGMHKHKMRGEEDLLSELVRELYTG